MDDWLAEVGVLVLHEVDGEAVLQHEGEVLLVHLPGPAAGRGVAGEAGQHHQPVIVTAHRAVLTLALHPGAAGTEPLLTTNLQYKGVGNKAWRKVGALYFAAGLSEAPCSGPHAGYSLLLPGQRIHSLQPPIIGIQLEESGAKAKLVNPSSGPFQKMTN